MVVATFPARVVEFFTLRAARRELAAVPDEARASALRALRLAFQKREAAETLWPRGSSAEALKLAAEALEAAATTLAAFPMEPPPRWLTEAQATATAASKRLADARLPALESETEPAHEELFRALIDALVVIEEDVGLSVATPDDLRRIGVTRMAYAACAAAVAIAGLAYALHAPTFSKATASGQYSSESNAEKAFDGNTGTGWFLPDHVGQGWIDLELAKPRPVHSIHILPSNPPYNDRDVKDARIDAMLGGVVVKSLDVTFPEPTGGGANWNDVVLDAPKCDHLRITTKTNYRLGLGIAEIELR